ncbi:RraA family protein [Halobacillus amylolyticus]|uniref:Putative 4-hydroxy-4-methyl-2-oxoglutarate aldolase n=1 Tax=Halobacillus amylolyticus TaxID=2932259 RepID=A0ABY4HJE3_9BACI|nr:RraA family protein [Halobacillus amylolyticus]
MVGCAITVKTRPSDNLMVHKAIDLAQSGDVIVVDAGGEVTHAIIGEIMMRMAQKKGIAGFVIHGAIRDSAVIREETFPIYARGVTHHGPYKDGPGEINVPITMDGTIVNPGDIIVGDEDGVVVVPYQRANDMIKLAQEQQRQEKQILQSIKDGTLDRKWVDKILEAKGCEFPDG